MLTFVNGLDRVNRTVASAVAWLSLVMIVVAFLNTTLRYVGSGFGRNLTWTGALDLQWYLFSVVFLGLGGYALLTDSNVRVDIVYSRLSDRMKSFVDLFGLIFFVIPFVSLVIYVSWPFVVNSVMFFEKSPDPGGLPRWIIKPLIPLAFALVFLQAVSQIVKHLAFLLGKWSSPYVEEI